MDIDTFVTKASQQAFNLAVRSGIAVTSKFIFGQCCRLIEAARDGQTEDDAYLTLERLNKQLDGRIKIVSPAIDLIELRSSRGNPSLESALPLATALHQDIMTLAEALRQTAATFEINIPSWRPDVYNLRRDKLVKLSTEITRLISRIDRDIPLLHLAISASGESLSSTLSPGTSPSRFLQASAFLNFGDTQFASDPTRAVQVGPAFTLSLYMLFLGHAGPAQPQGNQNDFEPYGLGENERKPIWQEVFHKARVRLCRTPTEWTFCPSSGYGPSITNALLPTVLDGYTYHIEMIENLDDGRLHEGDDSPQDGFDGIAQAGIRESLPVHQIAKIFYADTGRILNIGIDPASGHNPVLLLKRDVGAISPITLRHSRATPTRDVDRSNGNVLDEGASETEQDDIDRQLREESLSQTVLQAECSSKKRFPAHLDLEWIALEVFHDEKADTEDGESGGDDEGEDIVQVKAKMPVLEAPRLKEKQPLDDAILEQMRNICLEEQEEVNGVRGCGSNGVRPEETAISSRSFMARSPFAAVTTSLSLLEMLIRLASLQESQQAHHLTSSDAVLNFFLEETSTTGLAGEERWRARDEAKRRVGFDPYTDSPRKN